jgi:hypothetical protein
MGMVDLRTERFAPGKRAPISHWIFCWMNSGAGLQAAEKKKIHSLS